MFHLDFRLQKDTIHLGDFALSRALLMNERRYPWVILVPCREQVREYYHLAESDQQQLMKESSWVAEKMANHFSAQSMNVAALGNIVEQLHVHHVVRFQSDPAWPGPVWGHSPQEPYDDDSLQSMVSELSTLFAKYLVTEK